MSDILDTILEKEVDIIIEKKVDVKISKCEKFNNLFDFNSKDLIIQKCTVFNNSLFEITRSFVVVHLNTDTELNESLVLLKLIKKDNIFYVCYSVNLWYVIPSVPIHKLLEGDLMKMGNYKFQIRQLISTITPLNLHHEMYIPVNIQYPDLVCKFCCLYHNEESNPLFRPCNCNDTISHLECYYKWINSRLYLFDILDDSYFYAPVICDVCHSIYPTKIIMNQRNILLIALPNIEPPIIILENIIKESNDFKGHKKTGFHIVSLASKSLKLGRNHDCNVRIPDVSISKCHAFIHYDRNEFIIQDNKSQFGTFVKCQTKKNIQLFDNLETHISVGQYCFSLTQQ